jgi:hypothetical protein
MLLKREIKMSFLIIGLSMIGIVVAAILMRAWVFTILWSWFAVPYGLPAISIASAVGIALIVGMFTHGLKREDTVKIKTLSDFTSEVLSRAFGTPLATLLLGWIVTWFM